LNSHIEPIRALGVNFSILGDLFPIKFAVRYHEVINRLPVSALDLKLSFLIFDDPGKALELTFDHFTFNNSSNL
jgi:hypothetical protein